MPFISSDFISAVKDRPSSKADTIYLNPNELEPGDKGKARFSPVGNTSLDFCEAWATDADGKPRCLKFSEEPTPAELRARIEDEGLKPVDSHGKPTVVKRTLAMWVWLYGTGEGTNAEKAIGEIKLLQIRQVTILETLASLFSDSDVAEHPESWDFELIKLPKSTERDIQKYMLTLKPGRRKGAVAKEVAAAWEEAEKQGYNLNALVVGGDPTKAAGGLF
jgi:hypothetical protein